ncbi:uncharacterized protein LOC131891806 [Tigriopus californicus]|uniref:uncharacterized protein LOC131891806 n=1 Tax=Tigriopus californicus TaxID=6832 RepID=UPI0027DA7C13|nr:uncharacterized protein LOC131891806 [Tigriopus californicus]XP_059097458.1 uncharacterized protein LOC131891806 [Tigriopus californicus]
MNAPSTGPGKSEELGNLVARPIADKHQTPGAMSTGLIDDLNDNVTNLDNPTDLNLIPSRSPLFHCPKCRKTFASRFGCGVHVRKNACSMDSYCKEKHDHQLVELDVETMAVALEWFHSQEHDRFFCKESCRPSLRIFRCSQRTKKTSRVVKHTKKIYDCSAKIIFRQATLCQCEDTTTEICRNEKPRVLIYGCLSHCHPIERKNIRLSKVTKDHALNLLQSGLRHGVIIEKYFAPINDEPDHKLVVPADLYRIEKTANLHGYDHKLSEVANVSAMLLTPSFLAFNFGEKFSKTGFPHGLQDKLVETSGSFLLCYASEPMLQRFQRHPTVVAIDGTHGTNASKFIMISINVFGPRGEGIPVFQCLVQSENQAVFSVALQVLKSKVPHACAQVKILLSDTSHSFINAWRDAINSNVLWSVCHWHLEKSWTRKFTHNDMLNDIKGLRQIGGQDQFTTELLRIQTK